MRHIRSISLVLAAISALVLPVSGTAEEAPRPRGVVELFTSQGCNSCPPADGILAQLAQRGDVVALSYHVDYWDYRGWSDTLGGPENTARQRDYAKALGQRSVYTPQAVVNGRKHMSGANGGDIAGTLAEMDASGQGMAIDVSIRQGSDSIIIETGSGTHHNGKANILLLFLEPAITVEIERGENAGKSVTYANAVTGMQSAGLWHGEKTRLEIPTSELKRKGAGGCAVLLQSMRGSGEPGPIIGAAILDHPTM